MKKILILGASGSIGTQTIELLNESNYDFELVGFSVGKNVGFLEDFLKNPVKPQYFYLISEKSGVELQKKYPELNFFWGEQGLLELIKQSDPDIVVNALLGFSGFLPSVLTLELNKTLCLANKETLVVGGDIINNLLQSGHGRLIPIDSEHVAISKCLHNAKNLEVKTVYLTASGGPFFDLPKDQFKNIKPSDALKHPTWKMGQKITIDSATMMNKCFEVIEAHYLFGFEGEKIVPIVDRQSYIHSAVEFENGDIYAQIGPSDMKFPISYALNKAINNEPEIYPDVDLKAFKNHKLFDLDFEKFSLIKYGYEVIKRKGNSGAVLNAANEVLVENFLNGNINFIDIQEIIDTIMINYDFIEKPTIEDIVLTDKIIRKKTKELIEKNGH